jgi:hypothetical protein
MMSSGEEAIFSGLPTACPSASSFTAQSAEPALGRSEEE